MHGLWANKQNVERTKHKHKEAHQSAAHMALHWTFSSTVNVVKSIAGLHIPLYVRGATQSLPIPTHACSKQHDAQIAYNQKIQQAWPGRLTHTDSYAQQIELLEFAFENIMLIFFGRTFRFIIVHQNQLWESETWPLDLCRRSRPPFRCIKPKLKMQFGHLIHADKAEPCFLSGK